MFVTVTYTICLIISLFYPFIGKVFFLSEAKGTELIEFFFLGKLHIGRDVVLSYFSASL